jgi:hypothetical protein
MLVVVKAEVGSEKGTSELKPFEFFPFQLLMVRRNILLGFVRLPGELSPKVSRTFNQSRYLPNQESH